MNFPSSPSNGQTTTIGNKTYVYNGTGWAVQSTVSSGGSSSTFGMSLRNVATRPSICNSFNGTNKQTMSRSAHFARSPITSLRLLFGNWRVDPPTGEVGSGASTTYTASIEYPAGTFKQVLFSGATSAVVPNLGEVISDEMAVTIPLHAQFWIRTWTNNATGILYVGKSEATNFGEAMEFGVTTTDKTMSGTIAAGGAGIVTPYAILGVSNIMAPFLWGDSRVFGQSDVYTNSRYNDIGIIARSIGPIGSYISCATPGDRAEIIAGSLSLRSSLGKRFCTSMISALGINDLNVNGRSAAQIYGNLQTIWSSMQPLPIFQCTLDPVSSSTDSWATTANQTTAGSNAVRVALNQQLRESGLIAGVFELADQVETARDSGIWKAPGYTADGLHELQKACLAISNSRAIEVGRLV